MDFVSAGSATTADGSHVAFALWFPDDTGKVIFGI